MDIGVKHKLCDPSNLEAGKTRLLDFFLTQKTSTHITRIGHRMRATCTGSWRARSCIGILEQRMPGRLEGVGNFEFNGDFSLRNNC